MTIEKAINALDIVEHMESFSALYEPGEPMNQTTVGELKEACRIAISILRAQADTPTNAPLTLEELRGMDGEPVWVETRTITDRKFWGIVYVNPDTNELTIEDKLYTLRPDNCGKTWMAYRSKTDAQKGDKHEAD